uniref:unspecific monooxygenase n=1 Tax=Electrophorus electricus TaxID=8005 RepID=A0A4W4GX49_ELEEL
MNYFSLLSAEMWALLVLSVVLLVLFGNLPNRFFTKLGIPGPKPLPFLGNMLEYRKGFHAFDMECFKRYGRIWGIYEGRVPVLCILDKTIIKSVLVKECYSLFTNRRDMGLNGQLYDSLFVTKDDDWRRIRSVLSPSFTSGRLKEMFGIMKTHSNTLVKNLERTAKQVLSLQIKLQSVIFRFFGAYSMDVVTSTAFSVDIDSLNNPEDPFVTNIKKLFNFDFFDPLFLLAVLLPFTVPLLEKFNLTFFPASVTDFFVAALQKIKEDRVSTDYKVQRVDILQLMMNSQTADKVEDQHGDEIKKSLNDHEILSQSISFIFAGYETTSATLSFFFYNMATNPKIMKKLQEEIDQTFPDKAPFEYDAMMNMDYLDATLSESLRLYPVAARLDRICKKTMEINGLTIPKDMAVMIPTFPLHRDPEYWTDPDTFNPERFTKENKELIDPYTYMPFGAGPRNCIGMRFALVSMKLAIIQILQNFNVIVCAETKVPLELGLGAFLVPKEPIKLRFSRRTDSHSDNVCNASH